MQHVSAPGGAVSFAALWPTPTLSARCQEIENAINTADFTAAVLAASQLALEATGSEATGEPALEMLLRGVAPRPNFCAFASSSIARAAKSIDHVSGSAEFALHAVNELVC